MSKHNRDKLRYRSLIVSLFIGSSLILFMSFSGCLHIMCTTLQRLCREFCFIHPPFTQAMCFKSVTTKQQPFVLFNLISNVAISGLRLLKFDQLSCVMLMFSMFVEEMIKLLFYNAFQTINSKSVEFLFKTLRNVCPKCLNIMS